MQLMGSAGAAPRQSGFTLVEIVVTLAVLAILVLLAAPSMAEWIRNGQVRTVASVLQNGLQTAQQESVRLNRQVVFFLTDDPPDVVENGAPVALANGRNWAIFALPLMVGEDPVFVRSGNFADLASPVRIEGPAALCFNSAGRQVANVDPDIPGGVACAIDPADPLARYRIHMDEPLAHRPLVVTASLGGQTRMCDPERVLSADHPDGCPP